MSDNTSEQPEYEYLKKFKIVFEDSSLSNRLLGTITQSTLLFIDEEGKIKMELKGYSKDYEKLLKEALKNKKQIHK